MYVEGNEDDHSHQPYAGFALMLIALGVMMPMLRMRMAATKRTGKHMPITGGKHAK